MQSLLVTVIINGGTPCVQLCAKKWRVRSRPLWWENLKERKMNITKCPHCGVKLGNFLYADACPHCHEELKHNTRPLLSTPKQDPRKAKLWPVRMFKRL